MMMMYLLHAARRYSMKLCINVLLTSVLGGD
jgi:hypothetical protein